MGIAIGCRGEVPENGADSIVMVSLVIYGESLSEPDVNEYNRLSGVCHHVFVHVSIP